MSQEGIAFGLWFIPEEAIEESFSTTGGPGGQHANRSATGVTLRVDLSNTPLPDDVLARLTGRLGTSTITTTATESRSQWRNRSIARKRMAELLEEASRTAKPRRTTKPTRSSKERRLAEKRRRSEKKRNRQAPDDW